MRFIFSAAVVIALALSGNGFCKDLAGIKARGVIRHLGIPYANFVTGSDDGMDAELIKGFSKYLGVRYEYVRSDWGTVTEDLIGRKVSMSDGHPVLGPEVPVKGDLVANGFTVLPWREEIVDFSIPTFPSQIWLIARADSAIKPIKPSTIEKDIQRTRALMNSRKVLALPNTCLDPILNRLRDAGAIVVTSKSHLNQMAPALINREAELTILDAPDALIALEKWPGKIKIIGPLSPPQQMAVAFPKTSPELRNAFNAYLEETRRNGTYARIIKKYYPTVSYYFPAFFKQ